MMKASLIIPKISSSQMTKAQQLLEGLQSADESVQLQAAIEMCQFLVMGNEDTLTGFPSKQAVVALIVLLRNESNYELMNLACRALTYMMEVIPRSTSIVVEAVPVLLEKVEKIECMDVAEQSLTALEMLSRRHHRALLQAGAVQASLLYLDFFSMQAQRSALAVISNCCLSVNNSNLDIVAGSLPDLSNRLIGISDQKCIQSIVVSFSRLIENYLTDESRLSQIVSNGLIENLQQLLTATPPVLPSQSVRVVVRMLSSIAGRSPSMAAQLLRNHMHTTILHLILGPSAAMSLIDSVSSQANSNTINDNRKSDVFASNTDVSAISSHSSSNQSEELKILPKNTQELLEIACLIHNLMPPASEVATGAGIQEMAGVEGGDEVSPHMLDRGSPMSVDGKDLDGDSHVDDRAGSKWLWMDKSTNAWKKYNRAESDMLELAFQRGEDQMLMAGGSDSDDDEVSRTAPMVVVNFASMVRTNQMTGEVTTITRDSTLKLEQDDNSGLSIIPMDASGASSNRSSINAGDGDRFPEHKLIVPFTAAGEDRKKGSVAVGKSEKDERGIVFSSDSDLCHVFVKCLFPCLYQMFNCSSAGGGSQLRHKLLIAIQRMLHLSDSQLLKEVLAQHALSSNIAQLLAGATEDSRVASCAIQMCFVLMKKLPSIFSVCFTREGVMHEMQNIANLPINMELVNKDTGSMLKLGMTAPNSGSGQSRQSGMMPSLPPGLLELAQPQTSYTLQTPLSSTIDPALDPFEDAAMVNPFYRAYKSLQLNPLDAAQHSMSLSGDHPGSDSFLINSLLQGDYTAPMLGQLPPPPPDYRLSHAGLASLLPMASIPGTALGNRVPPGSIASSSGSASENNSPAENTRIASLYNTLVSSGKKDSSGGLSSSSSKKKKPAPMPTTAAPPTSSKRSRRTKSESNPPIPEHQVTPQGNYLTAGIPGRPDPFLATGPGGGQVLVQQTSSPASVAAAHQQQQPPSAASIASPNLHSLLSRSFFAAANPFHSRNSNSSSQSNSVNNNSSNPDVLSAAGSPFGAGSSLSVVNHGGVVPVPAPEKHVTSSSKSGGGFFSHLRPMRWHSGSSSSKSRSNQQIDKTASSNISSAPGQQSAPNISSSSKKSGSRAPPPVPGGSNVPSGGTSGLVVGSSGPELMSSISVPGPSVLAQLEAVNEERTKLWMKEKATQFLKMYSTPTFPVPVEVKAVDSALDLMETSCDGFEISIGMRSDNTPRSSYGSNTLAQLTSTANNIKRFVSYISNPRIANDSALMADHSSNKQPVIELIGTLNKVCELLGSGQGQGDASPFEIMQSGLVSALYQLLTFSCLNTKAIAEQGDHARSVAESGIDRSERLKAFCHVFLNCPEPDNDFMPVQFDVGTPLIKASSQKSNNYSPPSSVAALAADNNNDGVCALKTLVTKLVSCVQQLEQFAVKLTDLQSIMGPDLFPFSSHLSLSLAHASHPAAALMYGSGSNSSLTSIGSVGGSNGNSNSASAAIKFFNTHQLKCMLERHPLCSKNGAKQWKGGAVKIDPLAQMHSVEKFLIAKGLLGGSSSSSRDRDRGSSNRHSALSFDSSSGIGGGGDQEMFDSEDDEEEEANDLLLAMLTGGSTAGGSSRRDTGGGSRYAGSSSHISGGQHRLKLFIGDFEVPYDWTVYQAIHQLQSITTRTTASPMNSASSSSNTAIAMDSYPKQPVHNPPATGDASSGIKDLFGMDEKVSRRSAESLTGSSHNSSNVNRRRSDNMWLKTHTIYYAPIDDCKEIMAQSQSQISGATGSSLYSTSAPPLLLGSQFTRHIPGTNPDNSTRPNSHSSVDLVSSWFLDTMGGNSGSSSNSKSSSGRKKTSSKGGSAASNISSSSKHSSGSRSSRNSNDALWNEGTVPKQRNPVLDDIDYCLLLSGANSNNRNNSSGIVNSDSTVTITTTSSNAVTTVANSSSTSGNSSSDGCAEVLMLLRVLHSLNSYWFTFYQQAHPRPAVSGGCFRSGKIQSKVWRQLQDPLGVLTGDLPRWLLRLPLLCPFLVDFETRCLLFHVTSFDRDRALLRLQEMSTLDGSERQSDAQGAHGSSTAGGNGAGGGGGTSSSRHEHTSDRITPRLDRKKRIVTRQYEELASGDSSTLTSMASSTVSVSSGSSGGSSSAGPTTPGSTGVMLKEAESVLDELGCSRALLEIQFREEVGSGLGPTLEWYTLISHQLMRRDLDMWRHHESSQHDPTTGGLQLCNSLNGLFPRPYGRCVKSAVMNRVKSRFRLLGKFLARALMDNRPVDIWLSVPFFKWLIAPTHPSSGAGSTTSASGSSSSGSTQFISPPDVTSADLEAVDPDLYKIYCRLRQLVVRKKQLEADASLNASSLQLALESLTLDNSSIESLDLTFEVPGYNIEMCKGGKDTVVTIHNLENYLDLLIHWTLREGVHRQFQALKEGFETVFKLEQLRCFLAHEMEQLFCGGGGPGGSTWSPKEIADCCKFDHGYTRESRAVDWFLDIICGFSREEQRLFLQFVTGSPRLPVGGFRSLSPPLTIVRKTVSHGTTSSTSVGAATMSLYSSSPTTSTALVDSGALLLVDEYLPSVMTCVNYLKLPDYSSREVMADRLQRAIREGQQSFDLS